VLASFALALEYQNFETCMDGRVPPQPPPRANEVIVQRLLDHIETYDGEFVQVLSLLTAPASTLLHLTDDKLTQTNTWPQHTNCKPQKIYFSSR
jgi:hypothetical protein